jgi:hypothetical protein
MGENENIQKVVIDIKKFIQEFGINFSLESNQNEEPIS